MFICICSPWALEHIGLSNFITINVEFSVCNYQTHHWASTYLSFFIDKSCLGLYHFWLSAKVKDVNYKQVSSLSHFFQVSLVKV